MKIQRFLLSITFINAEKISKFFETHIYYVPRKVKVQLRETSLETNCASNMATIKNSLIKPFNNCVKKTTSPRAPIIETGLLKPCENTSLTNLGPRNNLFEMRNSSFLLSSCCKEEFYLVKRIHLIYIMSKSKKCPHYPTCSKKNFRSSKSHCVSNIFEQSCKVHNQLLKKSAMPCCGHMDSFTKKKRCIEKDYEHMLRQISKLMRTCKSENFKVRETSKHCYPKLPKKPKCKKEIVPLCENCKKSLKVKPKNICKPKCMNNFGKILKSTYNRCSKQAKTKLKNHNVGKVIKDTYGQCAQKAKMKLKTIHLDQIIKKLYGQCSQQVTSKLKTKLKPTKQDCYMFSMHVFPNQKLEREPKMCHFKENAVFQFWSIMNPEQSKIVNCAAISKRDTNIKNNTSIFEMQQRNYLKSKLLLIKKTTSVVFVDVNNFAEYDICLQGMFKNPSKGSHKSPKSISFDIPEDNGSSHSCVESWQPQHACIENSQDTDEPKCILCDNHVNEISNECKSNLCNAKTSPIKVKLPFPKCIDCTRDNKQCDMGLNTLPQNIEEACRPIINSRTPRIIRRQKITSSFPPDCIIEINNSGKDLRSLELLDCFQQLKKDGQQGRNKKCQRPFWIKLFQKITKKSKTSKKKLCKTSKELNKSFLKDDNNSNKILTFSDFKKMNAQQLIDIICELKKATSCDSPRKLIEEDGTSSESKSSNSFFGKGPKVEQKSVGLEMWDTNSFKEHLKTKRKVFTSNYSQCEKDLSKSVKNIYWRCATKDGKKKKKRNKLTKVKKPQILKQQIIKCHVSHRGMRFRDVDQQPVNIRDIDYCGKHLTTVHSIECIQSLNGYQEKIEKPYRPFWFKEFSNKTKPKKNQESQACEADIEEQCELVLEEHNVETDELTFSVFEISTEKQIKHVIYDIENVPSSYHSSLRKIESTQTCAVLDTNEPCNIILSEDIELTFSDFQTMNDNQLMDIICQLQNAMFSSESIARNPRRQCFEVNVKQCDDNGLTSGDFQSISLRQLKDIISGLEALNTSVCDTSNSSTMKIETSSTIKSTSSTCIIDGVQESVSSVVYSSSSYSSDIDIVQPGLNFLIRPNTANVHKFFRIFCIK
ncbi:PREDICTED: uncharacterized protein LOC106110281 [Papilio polytes]|uniref:uncharacterized protein LOC106110281 n=1 Tax=Papilio polytes TaxID=76194 RepID=UPI00067616B5|nr:PREDICTED: uncharacterized protein LOC106110281 [Papilio polytes]